MQAKRAKAPKAMSPEVPLEARPGKDLGRTSARRVLLEALRVSGWTMMNPLKVPLEARSARVRKESRRRKGVPLEARPRLQDK
jgi:hypothetical protein